MEGSHVRETSDSPFFFQADTLSTDITALWTVTGKVGYAWDRWLAYGKGGYAGGLVETSAFSTTGPHVRSRIPGPSWLDYWRGR